MIDYIMMVGAAILGIVLTIVLLAVIWCILIPFFIIMAKHTFKKMDKLSDKLYSKFNTKE